MKAALALPIALVLSACAASPVIQGPMTAGGGDDCAVIAAVAKEHYGFNTTDRRPPPLWLSDGRGWAPLCDWGRYGLAFPETHDPTRPTEPGEEERWVGFQRPTYDGQGAVIESSIYWGPFMGEGVRCRVRSGFAGWTVERCEQDWIS